jgi:hypothetical protein
MTAMKRTAFVTGRGVVSEEASYFTGQTVSVNGGSFVGW